MLSGGLSLIFVIVWMFMVGLFIRVAWYEGLRV